MAFGDSDEERLRAAPRPTGLDAEMEVWSRAVAGGRAVHDVLPRGDPVADRHGLRGGPPWQ